MAFSGQSPDSQDTSGVSSQVTPPGTTSENLPLGKFYSFSFTPSQPSTDAAGNDREAENPGEVQILDRSSTRARSKEIDNDASISLSVALTALDTAHELLRAREEIAQLCQMQSTAAALPADPLLCPRLVEESQSLSEIGNATADKVDLNDLLLNQYIKRTDHMETTTKAILA